MISMEIKKMCEHNISFICSNMFLISVNIESSSTPFVTIKMKMRNPGRFCEIIPIL